jgi:hypothetical protein
MSNPVGYGTRQVIVQNFLAAFYRLYLNNSAQLVYEVTADDVDDDIAVLQISSNGCADSFAALIRSEVNNHTNASVSEPSTNQNEDSNSQIDDRVRVIVHHEKAQRVLREELAEFFHRTFPEQVRNSISMNGHVHRVFVN